MFRGFSKLVDISVTSSRKSDTRKGRVDLDLSRSSRQEEELLKCAQSKEGRVFGAENSSTPMLWRGRRMN